MNDPQVLALLKNTALLQTLADIPGVLQAIASMPAGAYTRSR